MPVELRKRPPPKEPAAPPPPAKRGSSSSTVKKLAGKAKAAVTGSSRGTKKTAEPVVANPPEPEEAPTSSSAVIVPEVVPATAGASEDTKEEPTANGSAVTAKATASGKLSVGDKIDLDGFGGTVQTHDGTSVTVKELLEKSGAGIVIFTYPKASTPGCTNQACLFRDNYAPITGASLAVYGLSTDSPKANTTFATKQKLPYQLLCDPNATLTSAIGMKKPGPGKSTTRGVVVIDKQGTLRLWEQAGPAKTLEAVLEYIKSQGMTETGAPAAVAAPPADDPIASEEAAKLADPDTKMDEVPLVRTPSKSEQDAAETAAEVGETAAKIDSAEGEAKP
ncbi:hypothetical protein, variant 2 [Cladophialophora immunda]|uniref:thioredoxin-dependent peroxiredoxin n=1 Tax=Cladophialophora immunda TaxID=569365 RepID=A0A0D2CKD0_9EURO|nr:uncharacterized protein PV07_03254 [Cladophialophora immunda]XP_016251845.1 hypothetical protein, variant 1 [Cladophialophora immunda]XP_016251846.1 hypothetical protein, variant 2 [Cladophialophora immunda]KIW31628.1 hypothetical protein PV07_03254 [Cladophialophora immunda]KIW31629.1 hypothetical protein, variant 1 [Cladophialophora immunda]KIW31630.1 hypothetical protein, variant 2 [Cladophialophora immunda]